MRVGRTPCKKSSGPIGKASFNGIFSLVQSVDLLQQFHRLQLIHGSDLRLITRTDGIASETKEVANAQSMGAEQIRLQSNPVAITAGQLQHRFSASLEQKPAGRHTAHSHDSTAAICDVQSMHPPLQMSRHGQHVGRISSSWGHDFCRECLLSGLNRALERRGQSLLSIQPTTMQDWTCFGLNMQPKGLTMSSGDTTDPLDISLSAREIEIIQLVAEGLTNQEIADRLTISKRTVDNHVSNVFTKTGSKNRVALLNWSMDNGKICRDGFNCCALPDADPHEP
jgi:DNA-binding CsgD family transcriptional regulator